VFPHSGNLTCFNHTSRLLGLMGLTLALWGTACNKSGQDNSSSASLGISSRGDDGGGGDLRAKAPPSLKTVPVPRPAHLGDYVKDIDAAIRLGKAFFWEMQTGGDGNVACATCHFKAGTDNRSKNTLNPGANGRFEKGSANSSLAASAFPFHKLSDPDDRRSRVLADTDDIVGGQGVSKTTFVSIVPGSAADSGTVVPDPVFRAGNTNVRQVTGRNTPTVINAVFNFKNFWDGRANHFFNGISPFGPRHPGAHILVDDGAGLTPESTNLENSSLASQAVGPPNNSVEMSFDGRTFPELGRKLLSLKPLGKQAVHRQDSVLGDLADRSGNGLSTTYSSMIQAAYLPRFCDSNQLTPEGFTLMEANFSLLWGLAIQCYESTLVSDDSPFDRFMEGNDSALTAQQKEGLRMFLGQGGLKCVRCHSGAEFTSAAISQLTSGDPEKGILRRMEMAVGEAVYDGGFYNIGVRPTAEDLGVGKSDPFGNPLSFSRLSQIGVNVGFRLNPPVARRERVAVDGAFKVPSLRNVELTGPYMHNGGFLTLRQVVDFYTHGGDFHEQNINNLDPEIDNIGHISGKPSRKDSLVAFLKSLTDDRVRYQKAPFDHPQLLVPRGILADGRDDFEEIPAVGENGGPPIQPFLGAN